MPKIEINQKHSLSIEETRKRLDSLLAQFSAKYGFNLDWENDSRAKVSGSGVKGFTQLSDGNVQISLDLPLLLSPLKKKIQEGITAELQKVLS